LLEVIVVIVLISIVALLLLLGLSQGREQARLAGCRKNLGQIGFALSLYDQMHHRLPEIGDLGSPGEQSGSGPAAAGPLKIMLETLQLPDFTELKDGKSLPRRGQGPVPGEIPVPGFVCGSDPNALAGRFTAPISYRATTGDNPAGDNGAFAAGGSVSLRSVEAADGLSYTAAFSERLAGDGQSGNPARHNYQIVPAPVPALGCPDSGDPSNWRGDASSSWPSSDYRSTLYNHAMPPNGYPSCIASNGRSAFMGASSGHVRGVNLLLLDGSVTLVRPTINPMVWKEFARIRPPEADDQAKGP
jgi:type II secretory pathway pseudopilin PulG